LRLCCLFGALTGEKFGPGVILRTSGAGGQDNQGAQNERQGPSQHSPDDSALFEGAANRERP
jgi:hypothetical protein